MKRSLIWIAVIVLLFVAQVASAQNYSAGRHSYGGGYYGFGGGVRPSFLSSGWGCNSGYYQSYRYSSYYYNPAPIIYAPPPVIYRPQPIYYSQPTVIYTQPAPVVVRERPVMVQEVEVKWIKFSNEQAIQAPPAGFVQTGYRLHKHGSDAGDVDYLEGTINGRKVKIEYDDDGSIDEIDD